MTIQTTRRVLWGAFVGLSAAISQAATPATLPPLSFDEGHGSIDIIERLRFEDRQNNFDFNSAASAPTDDSWFVQRLRLGLSYGNSPDWSLRIQLQDAREFDSNRPKVPFILGAEGNEYLNLRLASVTWGDPKKSPVTFTLGRQLLAIGGERLVGSSEWNNFARSFDAAKAVWTIAPGKTTATAFVGSVVNMAQSTSGDGWKFDKSTTKDLLSGISVVQKLDARDTLEAYLVVRDKKDNTPLYTAPTAAIPAASRTAIGYDIGQDVYTLGARFVRPPKEGDLDLEVEAALQGGHVNRQTTAATGQYAGSSDTLSQDAWALHALAGYSLEGMPWKPRLVVEYNAASGDTNRNDDTNGSFMNILPSNHNAYGLMDVFSWKNMRESTASIRLAPTPAVTLRVDYHWFSLYSAQDAWYRANAIATVRPLNAAAQGAPARAGQELDIIVTWAPRPWLALDAGWAHFYSGPYLGATGAQSDASFFYAQTSFKF